MKHWIIAVAVAAVFLTVSLRFGIWQWSWLIWVGYAAYRFLDNRIHSHQEDNP